MKLKIAITVLILSGSLFVAEGKTQIFIITQYGTYDSTSTVTNTKYYHVNYGDSMTLHGLIQTHDPNFNIIYYPPSYVNWYCNGGFIGVTYGYQTIAITQAGLYTAGIYWGGGPFPPEHNIFLTVLNPTSIAENASPQLLITQNADEHSLLIKGLSETGNHQLEIFSLTGNLVKRTTIPAHQKEYVISMATIKRGYYIINISDNAGNFSRKLFLE